MEPNKSEDVCTVRFDEQMETWYVHTGTGRLPLSRVLLQHLVSLYNGIHRGSALTLVDRRALEELDLERRELAPAAPSLRDRIAAEERQAGARDAGLRCVPARAARLMFRLVRRFVRPRPGTVARRR
jgi:hypothetical protein